MALDTKNTIANRVPRNWASMLGIDNTISPNAADEMFINFTSYKPAKITWKSVLKSQMLDLEGSSRIESYSFFYPKDNIQEQIKHTYSDNASKLAEAKQGITNLVSGAVKVVTGGTSGALAEEPFLYTNTERRNFSINLPLFGYDDLEEDIYKPIRFFRKYSYPRKEGIIQYPHMFKITGGLFNTNQSPDSFYMLEDFQIDYSPDVKFLIGGFPVQANLTLGFTELTMRFANDFDEEPINVKVTQSGNVAGLQRNQLGYSEDISSPTSSLSSDLNVNSGHQKVIDNLVKNSQLGRRVSNLTGTVEEAITDKVSQIVRESSLFKKIDATTNIDPLHLIEVREILQKIRG